MSRLLREGRLQRLYLGPLGYALRGVVIVAPVVAGIGRETRQHLRQSKVQLALLQRDLGLRKLSVVIVFEGPRDRFLDGQGPLDRQVARFEHALIVACPLEMLLGGNRLGGERASGQRRDGGSREAAARSTGVKRGIRPPGGKATMRKCKVTHDAQIILEVLGNRSRNRRTADRCFKSVEEHPSARELTHSTGIA